MKKKLSSVEILKQFWAEGEKLNQEQSSFLLDRLYYRTKMFDHHILLF